MQAEERQREQLYRELAGKLGQLQQETETLATRLELASQLCDSTRQLGVRYGSMFAAAQQQRSASGRLAGA